jgi:hypothetical protein
MIAFAFALRFLIVLSLRPNVGTDASSLLLVIIGKLSWAYFEKVEELLQPQGTDLAFDVLASEIGIGGVPAPPALHYS